MLQIFEATKNMAPMGVLCILEPGHNWKRFINFCNVVINIFTAIDIYLSYFVNRIRRIRIYFRSLVGKMSFPLRISRCNMFFEDKSKLFAGLSGIALTKHL